MFIDESHDSARGLNVTGGPLLALERKQKSGFETPALRDMVTLGQMFCTGYTGWTEEEYVE